MGRRKRNKKSAENRLPTLSESVPSSPIIVNKNNNNQRPEHYIREFNGSEKSFQTFGSLTITDDEEEIKPSNIHVFSASSTLHGLSHIFALHHSSLRRFAWTVAFLTSLTLLLFQSSNRVIYYLNFPHVTRLDEVASEGPLFFPAITICNLNEFRFSKITKNDMYHVGQLLGFLDHNDTLITPRFYTEIDTVHPSLRKRMRALKAKIEELADFDNDFTANAEFNMSEFYGRTGHDISTTLLQCRYMDQICNATWFTESDEPKELKPSNFVFFASNSTLHGMNHIFTEGKFTVRRALWALAFFSSLSLFLYQAYDRYSYYRGHPHVTKLDEEEAQIMDFPAITICNMNSFRLSKVTTDDYFFIGESLLQLFDTDYSLKDGGFRDNRTWPFVKSRIDPILRQRSDYKPKSPNFNMFEFYNRTGHEVWGIVKSCKYRSIACNNLSLWQPVYTRYGKCYTFNSGILSEPLTTLKGGVDNGLEILLDTQQNEYMPVWAETDEISVEAGFKIQIHMQGEPPFIHELGFGISPGFQTLVATQEQRITFLPQPWGKCESGADKWKYALYANYSISACRITCETNFVYKNCECRMIHMPGNTTFCSPEQYKRCADKALDYLVMKDDSECLCDTPCEVIRYNLEMSALQLPSTQASSFLAYKYGVTEEYVKANFAKLNVFFEALNYETIEQKVAYEIPGLFGDIGGQMGLFIGASILTILELFDYLYEVMKEKTWGKKLRKVKNAEPLTETLIDGRGHQHIEDTASTYVGVGSNYTPSSYQNGRPDHQPSHQSMGYPTSSHGQRGDDYRSLPPPPPQYWGNSLAPHREDPESHQETNGGISLEALKHKLKSGGKETSLSYNDLYRMPEKWNSAAGGEYGQSSFTTLRYPTAASTDGYHGNAHPNMGYATSPRGVGSIFSPTSEMSQQQLPSMLGSPSRNHSRHGDYAPTIETDIH